MEATRLPEFRERFSMLRGEMSQEEFSKKLGISRPTVGLYESGVRIPDALTLKKIAEECAVSADWLLGLTDTKTPDISIRAICERTGLQEDAVKQLHSVPKIGEVLSSIIVSDGFDFAFSFEEIGNAVLTARLTHEKLNPLAKGDPDAIVTHFGQYRDIIQRIELALFRFSEVCRSLPNVFGANETIKELNSFIWTVLNEDNNAEHQEN